jgi:hypothetical protein
LVAASRPIWAAFLTGLLREIVAQERFQPLNNPDDGGTITQKTRLGARGERGDAGLAKKKMKFPPWTATDIGQLKSLAKQKAGAKKIAKTLKRTPGAQR